MADSADSDCPVCLDGIDCTVVPTPCAELVCEECDREQLKSVLEPLGERPVIMPCRHVMHAHCLIGWLDSGANRCPSCNAAVSPGTAVTGPDLSREQVESDGQLAREMLDLQHAYQVESTITDADVAAIRRRIESVRIEDDARAADMEDGLERVLRAQDTGALAGPDVAALNVSRAQRAAWEHVRATGHNMLSTFESVASQLREQVSCSQDRDLRKLLIAVRLHEHPPADVLARAALYTEDELERRIDALDDDAGLAQILAADDNDLENAFWRQGRRLREQHLPVPLERDAHEQAHLDADVLQRWFTATPGPPLTARDVAPIVLQDKDSPGSELVDRLWPRFRIHELDWRAAMDQVAARDGALDLCDLDVLRAVVDRAIELKSAPSGGGAPSCLMPEMTTWAALAAVTLFAAIAA